jgi:hypothetical protein
MATRTILITDCDCCGAPDVGSVYTIKLKTGVDSDPSGGPSSFDYKSVDICRECVPRLLSKMGEQLDFTQAQNFIGNVKNGSWK